MGNFLLQTLSGLVADAFIYTIFKGSIDQYCHIKQYDTTYSLDLTEHIMSSHYQISFYAFMANKYVGLNTVFLLLLQQCLVCI